MKKLLGLVLLLGCSDVGVEKHAVEPAQIVELCRSGENYLVEGVRHFVREVYQDGRFVEVRYADIGDDGLDRHERLEILIEPYDLGESHADVGYHAIDIGVDGIGQMDTISMYIGSQDRWHNLNKRQDKFDAVLDVDVVYQEILDLTYELLRKSDR